MKPQECDVYDALNETILSVSLSAPKPGIFLDTVKYVLVLGTFTVAYTSLSSSLISYVHLPS